MQINGRGQIVVTGDVTIDWNIAQRTRVGEQAIWQPYDWVRACWQYGGAALLAEVIRATLYQGGEETNPSGEVLSMAVPQGPFCPADDRFYHSYALWAEYSTSHGDAWRVKAFLGLDGGEGVLDSNPQPWQSVAEDTPTADLVVLDDANLGFRNQRSLWPQAITAEGAQPWILLKMARPIARGALWEHLLEHHADRLVVVIPVTDLRRTVVQISEGLSWERTAQDVVWELKHNPRINGLSRCAHTIISFDTAGAILLSRFADDKKKTLSLKSYLFFDPPVIEGMWKESHPGGMVGYTICLTASIARQLFLAPTEPDIHKGIQSGLAAMRDLHDAGYAEESGSHPRITFPIRRIVEVLKREEAPFSEVEVQDPTRFLRTQDQEESLTEEERAEADGWWTILHDQYRHDLARIATQIVSEGADHALQNVPQGRFGHLLTVDRREIESFRSIHALVSEYLSYDRPKRPLSIAVFGAPGSGKSFGITQVAKSLARGEIEVLEFNLSQFDGPQELSAALHQVRDVALSGQIPLVFWDEFDTPLDGKPLGWLRYFLAPMQDGAFREGQLTHSIGRALFVFAGGTSHRIEEFGQQLDAESYRAAKVPDFVSRLKGYVNILGPNPPELTTGGSEGSDAYFGIRRAILLRSILQRNAPRLFHQEKGKTLLNIDRGVLRAFLEVNRYKHGIRSMESIVAMSHLAGRQSYDRSSLPAQVQLDLHVDGEEFLALVQQLEIEGDLLETLAEAHHRIFCENMRKKGYRPGPVTDEEQKTHSALIPYEDLPEDEKAQNRAAVRDIPNKLARSGYIMIPARSNEPPFEFPGLHLEQLAKMEHARWMRQKQQDGWRHAEETDKRRKLHEALLPWDELSEQQREKDRVLVREIPRILAHAGYTVVQLQPESEDG